MIAVEREHRAQQWDGGLSAIAAVGGLCTQEHGEHAIAMSQVFMKEQHCRERSGKIVDLRLLRFELLRIVSDAAEYFLCLLRLLQLFKRRASPVGHVGDREHTHLLEVARLPRGALPPAFRFRSVISIRVRHAEGVFDVAFVGEEVPRLAYRLRWMQCGFEMSDRIGRLSGGDGVPCQQQASADELSEDEPFAALPRLKVAREQNG